MPDNFLGKDRVKRLHHRLGWYGRVYTDSYEGTDPATGRDLWTPDDTGTECVIRVEQVDQPAPLELQGEGEEHTADAVIIVDPDEVTVNDGTGDFDRASEIVDESTGERYRVLRIRNEHSGVLRCDCEIMTQ